MRMRIPMLGVNGFYCQTFLEKKLAVMTELPINNTPVTHTINITGGVGSEQT